MKRLSILLSVLLCSAAISYALVTPGKTDHIDYCTGANNSNCVFQVDASGNLTTAGSLTTQSTLAVTGASTFTGATTVAGTTTATGKLVGTRTTIGGAGTAGAGVFGSSTVIPTSLFTVIVASPNATAVLMTGTPTISTITATDGQFLVLKGTSAVSTFTLQDNGTLVGSLVELGAATRVISNLKVLTLMFDSTAGVWLETAYGNN